MTKSYTAEVLVLSKTKLGESDLILTLLSSEDGQLRAVTKGARKPGAKLCGISEPFNVFAGKFHKGKSLDICTEAKAIEAYAGVRSDYDRLMVGSIALELAAQVTNDGDSIPRLYAMTRTFLDVLGTADEEILPTLLAAYLLKVNAMIGYSPEHELCARNARLSYLFQSTFSTIRTEGAAEDTTGDNKRARVADVRQVMNFTEKHLPANLKSLSYYRKSL